MKVWPDIRPPKRSWDVWIGKETLRVELPGMVGRDLGKLVIYHDWWKTW